MNSSSRWLVIFAIVIGILVITTISLVLLVKGNEVTLLPEDTPQGIVQRYLIAIQEKDYPEAYDYLRFNTIDKTQTYDDWYRTIIPLPSNQATWKATLGNTAQKGNGATVEVVIDTIRQDGPFGNYTSNQQIIFQLSKFDGKWLITSPTYVYWTY